MEIEKIINDEEIMSLLEEIYYNGWRQSDESFHNEFNIFANKNAEKTLKESFRKWFNRKFQCEEICKHTKDGICILTDKKIKCRGDESATCNFYVGLKTLKNNK